MGLLCVVDDEDNQDILYWPLEPKGIFSTKTAYEVGIFAVGNQAWKTADPREKFMMNLGVASNVVLNCGGF